MNPLVAIMIKASGHSWWQVRYSDGRVLSEWDTLTDKTRLPIGLGRSSHWEEIPKNNMIGIRLLCPNGIAGELEAPEGHRFFQLKVGGVNVGIGFTGNIKGINRFCDAHIIGVVIDVEGNCLCRAWETKEKRLIEFHDNVFNFRYRNIGPLSLEVQGLKL